MHLWLPIAMIVAIIAAAMIIDSLIDWKGYLKWSF